MVENNIALDTNNKEQQKAFQLVKDTNTSLFITGKAGTGKTTFIKRIQEEIEKNFLVLAPTGVAALKVGGQTMHSFFKFPFEVITPETKLESNYNLNRRAVLEKVDTIIVDEVSMVRCDLVDAMDRILRKYFSTNMPFGGKQVIFVGDLCQLPPVVNSNDREALSMYYGAGMPFFYKAHVLKRMNLPMIEFNKVYRQSDEQFINVLNNMRMGVASSYDLNLLNQHVGQPNEADGFFITLSTVNNSADIINAKKLEELDGEEYTYNGVMSGNFKPQDCLVPEKLNLKVGAQVIICRNYCVDGCVNGTIAQIAALDDDQIKVRLEDGCEAFVEKVTWNKCEKVLNEETGKLEDREVGSFVQYPLKLAWAITIHKSQGMTFDRMHLDLSGSVFACGQLYVAISRMRSLEGLTLSRSIAPSDIKFNNEVGEFYRALNNYELINDELAIGSAIKEKLDAKDYDGAARVCMEYTIAKVHLGDYRNAALLAKKMFDVMLDDDCLLGLTGEEAELTIPTITCNFLNAVICLYGNRFEMAINYVEKVLERKLCLPALFIKARALYALGKYDEAYDVNFEIGLASGNENAGEIIDQKQYLFEAKLNEKLGNSNADICKKLIKICPACLDAYAIMRREAMKDGKVIEDDGRLFNAFNDTSITDEAFVEALVLADKRELTRLRRKVSELWKKNI